MTKYPASFETLEGVVRLNGEVDFTDPANQPGAGLLVPIADAAGVIVDTTTYADTIKGGGAKLTTLVFPADAGALAIAIAGDAFPRWVMGADPNDYGFCASIGNVDPPTGGAAMSVNGGNHWNLGSVIVGNAPIYPQQAASLDRVSPYLTITAGALPTQQLVSGAAAQVLTTRDVELVTPVTLNPTAGAAATCKIELSADNATYSSLGIETLPPGVALDGTIRLVRVRVPSGWYVKATVANAVLGLSTYY